MPSSVSGIVFSGQTLCAKGLYVDVECVWAFFLVFRLMAFIIGICLINKNIIKNIWKYVKMFTNLENVHDFKYVHEF